MLWFGSVTDVKLVVGLDNQFKSSPDDRQGGLDLLKDTKDPEGPFRSAGTAQAANTRWR